MVLVNNPQHIVDNTILDAFHLAGDDNYSEADISCNKGNDFLTVAKIL